MHAQEDDGRWCAAAAYLSRRLYAIQNRHFQVHYNDVRVVLLHQRDRFAPIGSLTEEMKTFRAFGQHTNTLPYNRVVIRKQDSDWFHSLNRSPSAPEAREARRNA